MTLTLKGHNMRPRELNDFLIFDIHEKSTGRIKLTNTIIKKYLKRKYDPAANTDIGLQQLYRKTLDDGFKGNLDDFISSATKNYWGSSLKIVEILKKILTYS